MKSRRARLTIESIAAGGDGVGRLDGLAVFVPRTAPGDVVDAVVRISGRFGRGEVVQRLESSGSRVTPLCRHYEGDDCGGCQLQHLAYAAQLDQKRRIVHDALQRIGRRVVEVPPVVPSPSSWRYRSRLTLTLRRGPAGWTIGLHSRQDPGRVFPLSECPITDDRVVAAWREIAAASSFLPDGPDLRGTVRLMGSDLACILEGGVTWSASREFVRRCPALAVVRWRPANGPPRVVLDRRTAGAPEEAFDQVNRAVADLARAEIVERALAHAPRTAVDGYSGLGATAAALLERGVAVTAIEADADAAAHSARLHPSARVLSGRVEELLERALPADVVILNPPRAGVDARVTDVLGREPRPRAVLYMSCDAATLARDVARLPAWRVASLRAFDMFPQTAHVEIICELTPEAA
jgi:23S rRNA (uracil1939-C5)-methyltransferase